MELPAHDVARRLPAIGRWLGIASLLSALLPIGLVTLAGALHQITQAPAFARLGDAAFNLIVPGITLAAITMILGALESAIPLQRLGSARLHAGPRGLRIEHVRASRWIPRDHIRDGLLLPGFRPHLELRLIGDELLDLRAALELAAEGELDEALLERALRARPEGGG